MALTEREKAYQRAWQKANGYKAQIKYKATHSKSLRERNRDKQRASEYYWKNRDAILANERDKRLNEPLDQRRKRLKRRRKWDTKYFATERGSLNRRKQVSTRRARIRKATEGPIDLVRVLARAEGRCGICRKPLTKSIDFDHIIPLARGGPHVESNLQATHPSCNRRKRAA